MADEPKSSSRSANADGTMTSIAPTPPRLPPVLCRRGRDGSYTGSKPLGHMPAASSALSAQSYMYLSVFSLLSLYALVFDLRTRTVYSAAGGPEWSWPRLNRLERVLRGSTNVCAGLIGRWFLHLWGDGFGAFATKRVLKVVRRLGNGSRVTRTVSAESYRCGQRASRSWERNGPSFAPPITSAPATATPADAAPIAARSPAVQPRRSVQLSLDFSGADRCTSPTVPTSSGQLTLPLMPESKSSG